MSKTPFLDAVPKGMGFKVLDTTPGAYDYEWWNGRCMIWELPRNGESYVLGIDVAEGVGGDRTVIEILRRGTDKRPDEQVAEFATDHHNPIEMVPIVNALGRFYCDDERTEAMAVIECNTIGGQELQLALRTQYDYGNLFIWKIYDRRTNVYSSKLGWWTNRTTRPKLIVRGLHAMERGDLVINSPFLLDEMEDFQQDHFMAKAKARFGRHDDRVISILMAHVGAHDDEWLAGEDTAEQRRLLTHASKIEQATETKVGRKADFQNTAITYEEMCTRADEELFE
jgi:hypothetical protein